MPDPADPSNSGASATTTSKGPRLPRVREPSRGELVWFDLRAGLPTALRVLGQELGRWGALRAVGHQLLRSLGRDPLKALSTADWPEFQEPLVRHQLRAAVLMDDVLTLDLKLEPERRARVLGAVISETGATFIGKNVPFVDLETWSAAPLGERERFGQALTARLFNAKVENLRAVGSEIGFDVTRCRFVELCRALERPGLATLFCQADAVYFERKASPLELRRSGTLATGAKCCDFRFSYRTTSGADPAPN